MSEFSGSEDPARTCARCQLPLGEPNPITSVVSQTATAYHAFVTDVLDGNEADAPCGQFHHPMCSPDPLDVLDRSEFCPCPCGQAVVKYLLVDDGGAEKIPGPGFERTADNDVRRVNARQRPSVAFDPTIPDVVYWGGIRTSIPARSSQSPQLAAAQTCFVCDGGYTIDQREIQWCYHAGDTEEVACGQWVHESCGSGLPGTERECACGRGPVARLGADPRARPLYADRPDRVSEPVVATPYRREEEDENGYWRYGGSA